jgi:hypothetical protein
MVLQVPSISDLPLALTARVLSHVPQQQRLTQCALVCRDWAAAATRGTVHVQITRLKAGAVAAFKRWLRQHARQLLTLKLLTPWVGCRLSLRSVGHFQQLQRLELECLDLTNEPRKASSLGQQLSDAATGVSTGNCGVSRASLLPSLQHLELLDVRFDSIDSLLQITAAPQLTSLSLGNSFACRDSFVYTKDAANTERLAAAVAAMLQRLLQPCCSGCHGWSSVICPQCLLQMQLNSTWQQCRGCGVSACHVRGMRQPSTCSASPAASQSCGTVIA